MRMLLVESHPGSARALGEQLALAGHDVTSCCDEESLSPCRNVEHGEDCPLERHVDVAIIAKSATSPRSLFEMGGVCAERHRVPVIEVDETDCGDIGVILSTLEQATTAATVRTEEAYAESVRAALGRPELAVDVERSERRVRVVIHLTEPADSNTRSDSTVVYRRLQHPVVYRRPGPGGGAPLRPVRPGHRRVPGGLSGFGRSSQGASGQGSRGGGTRT